MRHASLRFARRFLASAFAAAVLLGLGLGLGLGLLGPCGVARAEDEPAKPPQEGTKPSEPPVDKPVDKPADKPAEDPEATPAAPEAPKAAFLRIQTEGRKAGNKAMAVVQELAGAYLADVEKRGATYEGEEALALARIQALAGKREVALATFRGLLKVEGLADDLKDEARRGCIDMLLSSARSGDLKDQALADAVSEAEGLLGEMGEKTRMVRGSLHLALGMALAGMKRDEDAVKHYEQAGMDQPMIASRAANLIIDHMLEQAKTVEAYPAAREAGKAVLARFAVATDDALAQARKDGNDQLVTNLENARKRLDTAGVPLELAGNTLPAWTVAHSFQGGNAPADYEGKVVLVDFWATWCPWCIKSFPAMRQLLEEYGEKGFVIVGVTASSGNVFDARYDLDDDLKAKAPADWKPTPALRLAPNADDAAKAEHKAKEKDVIATFLKNHEVPWDVVMIDETEPGPKYGLAGWPYGIVLDKKGRVRRMHAGAILKEKPEQMEEMRKLIEALLAE